ncbi:MAG: 16S rRNA (cytosine(1402)-N(4))-methyltransferase RsmH [Dehalococcoidales bacterium]|nr:16S rRNA (cytosine(1402)-N(4))-methyltransferase RsmH [Dehalococcoidales bacterium]
MRSYKVHVPVMKQEVIEGLAVQPGGRYIDCTAGSGGHAGAILKYSSPGGQLLGIDADPSAADTARRRLAGYGSAVVIENDNFVNLEKVCAKYDFMPVHGILLDLGLSSMQLTDNGRGFSFQYAAPLDMRFNPEQKITAEDIVNRYSEADLARIIRDYGEEPAGNRIARAIVNERPLSTTIELVKIVEQALGFKRGRIHPATRTFQALRIAVNNELEHLESTLRQAVNLLGYEGRLVVITYHSLEDRIVKQFMQHEARDCVCPPEAMVCECHHTASLKLINRKVITPAVEEISRNPRSRSAKLRIAERTASRLEWDGIAKRKYNAEENSGSSCQRSSMLKEACGLF